MTPSLTNAGKPEDIPQDVWTEAERLVELIYPSFLDNGSDVRTVARAIMAAKAEEREACLSIAVDVINGARGTGDNDLRSVRARVEIAIRKRAEG